MTTEAEIRAELDREFGFMDGRAVYFVLPYGSRIRNALANADALFREGVTLVCLVPFRPDTSSAHDYCRPWEVRLIRGRIRFGDAKSGAPFPSAVVVMGPSAERASTTYWWDRRPPA